MIDADVLVGTVFSGLSVDGRRVLVRVRVRRMRCRAQRCSRQTFREQVPGVLECYQRRTVRLKAQLRSVVREQAGRAAARDADAVNAALSTQHHNGRTEGVNTRTKMIKRQMYARAGFKLLRHRILPG